MARGAGSDISGDAANPGGVVAPTLGYGREKFSQTRDSLLSLSSCCLGLAADDDVPGDLGGLIGAGTVWSLAMPVPQLARFSDEKSRK